MSDDLKIEFPKVKIDKLAPGKKCPDDIFVTFNPLSDIERIVRDIKDRQDNIMAMKFTRIIGQLLKDNGVVPKITEFKTGETFDKAGKVFEERYGVVIEGLDFTEHDKVFMDKIAELKKDYQIASELLGKYQQENESLKQHIEELMIENESLKSSIDIMATSKSEWIDRAVEWHQKCEELESKEADKPTNINLNDQIKVKLTPLGAEIYYHQYDELNKNIKANGGTPLEAIMPQIDKDGYTKFTLWHFMELYGQHFGMCKPNVIEPLNIYFEEV